MGQPRRPARAALRALLLALSLGALGAARGYGFLIAPDAVAGGACTGGKPFLMEWRMVPPIAPPAQVLPKVRDVRIVNVSGTTASVGLIHGLKESPIEPVSFERCHVRARRGLVVENVVGLDLSGLDLKVAEGEPVIRRGA